ncbi:BEL1-like homeodomain protein 1 [Canna indica]|uniref:BEL1-like homeodomain protein 1 n=1 Tax=Canna indica TaxID=4628 RepID=A0AAQ3KPM1_9LILI|nr:BEL1-like homeodomain protein 1 [Canna indica]
MATYFHGAPEVQPDGLQTLYLMNPGFVGYGADVAAPAANMFFHSSSTMNSLNPLNLAHSGHQNQQQQYLSAVPLQTPAERSILHYNNWPPPATASSNGSVEIASQLAARRATQQGLSLSLSPHELAAAAAPGITPLASTDLAGSKYLRAAQQLLDEVVNVGKGIKDERAKAAHLKNPPADGSNLESKGPGAEVAENNTNLSTAEKQELQMKKTKLVNMLEEVEQRYRQYRHQIQIVVSSFESVAGFGSARTYTALALRTISKQFRCLRDAIAGQIRATSKSLGEEADAKSPGSRLRFIDHYFRQQKALQQLGMVQQQNAWRPQRGLPERSVSVLRAWLFEHFLHPYPKDSDKTMLAKQTGLTRSQVSNWFINARVRLWKPMVEEMYLEETKDRNGDDNTSKNDANGTETMQQNEDSYDKGSIAEPTTKKARSDDCSLQVNAAVPNSICVEAKRDEPSNGELLMQFMEGRSSHGGNGFGLYPIGELGRFDAEQFAPRFPGSGVSLTLGLQHSENISLPGAQPSLLSSESIWGGGWR